jgi:general L-amino acid transport system permease protein
MSTMISELPPPPRRRKRGRVGSILVLAAALGVAAFFGPKAVRWAILDAVFPWSEVASCDGHGACWLFVGERLPQFIYGFYPAALRWRLNLGFLLLLGWLALPMLPGVRRRPTVILVSAVAGIAGAFLLAAGGPLGLAPVETDQWGGLFVTVLLSITAMVSSLPAGIFLALGRQAQSPALRGLANMTVEVVRGVPLLAILFMAVVLLPLFMPGGEGIGLFTRVVLGLCLYASAYMAEVIRGALRTIPSGQGEAARALGLGYWHSIGLVVLPQVFRAALPNIVSTFIQMLKDSTLVLVVGVFDLLGVVHLTVSDPKWVGYSAEGYLFAGMFFFAICFGLSRVAARMEHHLNPDRKPST